MKLKNSALQELYDALVSAGVSMSPYADSPVYKAFRECDEKLSSSVTFARIKDLQDCNDILRKSEATLLEANVELASKKRQLEKEIDDAKNQLKYFMDSRDAWRGRAKHAENEVEELKKAHDELFDAGSRKISELRRENEAVNKKLEEEVEELKATLDEANTDRTELQNDRNFYHDLYAELRKDYDKLFNNYKNKCEDIWELKSRLNSIYGKGPDYESCFNAMIDGFETVGCPYLGRPSITIQYDPDAIVFRKED